MKQLKTKLNPKTILRGLIACFLGIAIAITPPAGNFSISQTAMAVDTGDNLIYTAPETLDAVNKGSCSYTLSATTRLIIIPISVSQDGFADFYISLKNLSPDSTTFFTSSADLDSMIEKNLGISQTYKTERTMRWRGHAKDFYLVLMKAEEDYGKEGTISVNTDFTPLSPGREIQEGEKVNVAQLWEPEYYKFNLPNDSEVKFEADDAWEFEIFNSSKKKLGKIYNKQKAILKKGTYYVTTTADRTTFSYATKKIKISDNTSKKKAKTISLGEKVTVTFPMGEKKRVRFYKLKFSKSQKISIKSNHPIGKIYNSKGKIIAFFWEKNIKVKKGTYYFVLNASQYVDTAKYSFTVQQKK